MVCCKCKYYEQGMMSNQCKLTQMDNFQAFSDDRPCLMVTDNGELNFENEFIRYEFGTGESEV